MFVQRKCRFTLLIQGTDLFHTREEEKTLRSIRPRRTEPDYISIFEFTYLPNLKVESKQSRYSVVYFDTCSNAS